MASFKQVTLKDPVTGEYLSPRVYGALEYEVVEDGTVVPPYTNDADSLGGKPASDYVTNDILEEKITEIDQNITNITESVTNVTNKVYPISEFSDNKSIELTGDNTIIEYGPDYTIETTFVSETQIIQTLSYGDKQYTKYIDFTEDTITETVSVTEIGGETA